MRIGQVTEDNYKDFLRILGMKDNQNLERLAKKKKDMEDEFDHSLEAAEASRHAAGYFTEGMLVREGDDSWKKIVPVPDSVKNKVVDKVREIYIARNDGMMTAEQGDELAAIIKDYYKTLPPSERLSASWTLQKISQAEGGRISDYIKSQVPGWQPGQAFDTSILTNSNFGLVRDIWI